MNNIVRGSFLLPLAFMLCALMVYSFASPIGDFGNYYYASKFLISGEWGLWIYDPASFNLKIYELGQRNFFLNYTPVPPLSAILYTPFALFPVGLAKLVWNLFNSILLLFTVYRLQKTFNVNPIFWWVFPFFFFIPLRSIINEGQSYMLVLFLLVEGFIQYKHESYWKMALYWAICIHLKISPAFVIPFLLFDGNLKGAVYVLLTVLFFTFISIPILGGKTWEVYLFEILPRLSQGEINFVYSLNYQSMDVMLKTLFVPDVQDNQNAWFASPAWYQRLLLIFKVMVITPAIFISFSSIGKAQKFAIWLLCSMLLSGYGNAFSLILLLIPILFLYPALKEKRWIGLLFGLFLLAATVMPFYWFSNLNVLLRFPRLYAFVGLFLTALIAANFKLKWYAFLPIILAIIWPVSRVDYPQNYLANTKKSILEYDFSFDKNEIAIHSFDMRGPFITRFPLGFEINKAVENTSKMSKPHKREKLFLVNDSIPVYLSDLNKGVGFYTIRIGNLNK